MKESALVRREEAAVAAPVSSTLQQAFGAFSPAVVVEQVRLVQDVMRDVMRRDEHYGVIPGTGTKPSLLKPGAEKLGLVFRLAPEFTIDREDLPNGHREYRITCTLRSIHSGLVVGQGVGSCSTMESKYRYRSAARKCPECEAEAIIKGKAEYGGGWLCFKKKGGCGAKWQDGDAAIEGQTVGKVENPDIADQYNTVLKMAKKRAHVDAILTATAASDIFTQDIEDLPYLPPVVAEKPANVRKVTPVGRDEPEPAADMPSEGLRKRFHVVGVETYGEGWDAKRSILVDAITKGQSSSSTELTAAEMRRLIDGMQRNTNGNGKDKPRDVRDLPGPDEFDPTAVDEEEEVNA